MNAGHMTFDPLADSARSSTAALLEVPTDVANSRGTGHGVPLFVPREQAYYWSLEWQMSESESLREILDGGARRFATGREAADWLLSDDDD